MIKLAICSADKELLYDTYEAAVLFSLETETELEIYKFTSDEEYGKAAESIKFDAVLACGELLREENAHCIDDCQTLFENLKKRS